jgi:hypothetical protein
MKITRSTSSIKDDEGILYLVLFELEGRPLVKIGVTARNIEDRVSEILVSIFKKYREFPYCKPKRFRKTDNVYGKEAILHNYFKDFQYCTEQKFSGSTEFFDIPLDTAVEVYERLLNGVDILEGR